MSSNPIENPDIIRNILSYGRIPVRGVNRMYESVAKELIPSQRAYIDREYPLWNVTLQGAFPGGVTGDVNAWRHRIDDMILFNLNRAVLNDDMDIFYEILDFNIKHNKIFSDIDIIFMLVANGYVKEAEDLYGKYLATAEYPTLYDSYIPKAIKGLHQVENLPVSEYDSKEKLRMRYDQIINGNKIYTKALIDKLDDILTLLNENIVDILHPSIVIKMFPEYWTPNLDEFARDTRKNRWGNISRVAALEGLERRVTPQDLLG